MLSHVTITGADDHTVHEELISLSEEFPFVEWGILVGSHSGGDRFPSREWIIQLIEARGGKPVNLSLHVCGQHLRDIAAGSSKLDDWIGPHLFSFQRVQLNWHGERQRPDCSENVLAAIYNMDIFGWDPTIIFQLDGVNDELYRSAARRFACVGLFDRSHGAGVLPGEWPQCSTEIPCGWAGGLGPDNLRQELPRIAAKAWPVLDHWVDMETRVRTDGELDMAKVRACLEIAATYMQDQANDAG